MTTAHPTDPTLHARLTEDEANREFIQNQVELSCFVEAGAGSGKTVMLIQRLLTLIIEHDTRIDQIAAITFNEAAAAELTARLRRALIQVRDTGAYTLGNGQPRTFANPEQAKDRAAAALEGLPGAALGTLHSFCLRVLKQYPLEAGLPPKVDAVDELAEYVSPAQHGDAVIEVITALVAGDEDAITLIDALPTSITSAEFLEQLQFLLAEEVKLDDLRELVVWMDAHWGELGPTVSASVFVRPSDDEIRDFLTRNLTEIRDLADTDEEAPTRKLNNLVKFFNTKIDQVATAEDLSELELKETKAGGETSVVMQAKKRYDTVRAIADSMLDPDCYALTVATTTVRPILAALVQHFAHARHRTGSLEFHDMVYLTQQLVKNPSVRAKLHDQYRVIFVDEFQDTDPAQLDIVTAIARGSGDTPRSGHLFMVGDPKQSIYKFRNADIDTYVAARTSAAARDAEHGVKQLSRNFRSSQSVVAAVNELYGQLFDAHEHSETDGPAQAEYAPMVAQESTDGRDGAFIVLQDTDLTGLNSDEVREREGADVVALIRSATTSGAPLFVHHKGTHAGEALRYSDIAIVVPTHNDAKRLMQVLDDAGIPWVSEGSGTLFATPELNDLFTVLRAVADPADDFTRVAALRTALVGCSDADIARWAQVRREHRHDAPEVRDAAIAQDEVAAGVDTCVEQLRRFSAEAQRTDAATMVRRVVAEFGLAEGYAASGHPDNLPRVHTTLALADRFAASTGRGLREFVAWADTQAESNQGVSEPLLDTGVDAVRFMTIHKSKGREFPMVIAAGMSGRQNKSRPVRSFAQGDKTAEFKLKDAQTPGYLSAKGFDDLAEANELIRLLYVAMTRAKSVLAIPLQLCRNKPTKDHPAGKYSALQRGGALATAIDESSQYSPITREELPGYGVTFGTDAEPASDSPMAAPSGSVSTDQFEANAKALEAAAGVTQRMGVTAIAHAEDQTNPEPTADPTGVQRAQSRPADDAVPRHTQVTGTRLRRSLDERVAASGFPARQINSGLYRDNAGTDFGTAVHDVMEHLPQGGDLEQVAATVSSLYELPASAVEDVVRVAACFTESAPYTRSLEADARAQRELPVIGTVDGTAVNGYIDLLYRDTSSDTGGWVIADWKTDVTARAETVTSYFLQLDIYATLLEEALGEPVTRLELIFAGVKKPQVVVHERGVDKR